MTNSQVADFFHNGLYNFGRWDLIIQPKAQYGTKDYYWFATAEGGNYITPEVDPVEVELEVTPEPEVETPTEQVEKPTLPKTGVVNTSILFVLIATSLITFRKKDTK